MKSLMKWIGIVIAVLFVIGMFAGGNSDNAVSASTTTAEGTKGKETFRTTAQQLFAAYESNEVATDEKMKGMQIEVSGSVQSIDKDFTDSIVLNLRTSNEFMPARMGLKDSEKKAAVELAKGQKVVVLCQRMTRLVGSPSGADCVLGTPGKS